MNKYVYNGFAEITGLLKCILLKVERKKSFRSSLINLISPSTEITVDRGGKLLIGKILKMRKGSVLRVRKKAVVSIGKNFSISNNCMIVSHNSVQIGDNVQLGPGVFIYDHDHDFRTTGGISSKKYKSSPIKIGDNVWIGANSIILRGSVIGNNSVIAAGTVIKGKIPDNTLVYQKRNTELKRIRMNLHDKNITGNR